MTVGGIVLCGGRSSRMGAPKAWLPFGAELMLPRVVRIVGGAVGPVVVVAAPKQDVPPLPPGVRIVRDEVEGRGPLGGLAAGLAALEGEADAVYLSSCDAPLLKPEFVRRVIELGRFTREIPKYGSEDRTGFAACVPSVTGRLHPLAAAYNISASRGVSLVLAGGRLRMTDLFKVVPTRFIGAAELAGVDSDFLSLRNLNTPEDYEAALRAAD